ncbi:MAG: DUF4870 domain-containing protein [Acidimicrobiia bacterium]|nr:DUF4870 domain-containing protein [Acidimicrobiia bacterium]
MEEPFSEQPAGGTNPPPGWYPIDGGQTRYWDGEAWTDQIAPAQPVGGQVTAAVSSINENQMAMFAHLGQLVGLISGVGGFVVPLIIMVTKGNESPFVRRAAVESLNFWITGLLAFIVAFVLLFVLIGFILLPLVALIWLILPIYAGIKANEGVDYRYPFNLRLIK